MAPEWVVPRQGLGGEDVEHAPGHPAVIQPLEQRHLIDLAIERVRTFVGDARFKVRFPSPNQRDLLA